MERTRKRSVAHGDSHIRRLLHAVFSAVVPGTGQLAAGARRRGVVLLAVAVAIAVCAVVLVLQGVDQILVWLLEPSVLLALLAVNFVVLAFRLYAVVDAYQTRRPGARAGSSRARRAFVAGAGLGVLLLLTVAPHAVAGYYTYVEYDLVTTVFLSDSHSDSTTTSLPSTSVPGSTASSSPARQTTSSVAATTTTTAAPIQAGDDQRLTIMFIGTDEGYGRTGARADVIMVATFALDTGRVALFSIPRNTGSVELSDAAAQALGKDVYIDLISSLYSDANEHPELAPEGSDAGAVVLRDAVSKILGIPVDYYAVVNMGGLVDLIDAFDGVTVNVEERLRVRLSPPTPDQEWRVYDIQPGVQHLDGLEALAFARSRTNSNDYVRMGRQRCVIAALFDQNGMGEIALKFPAVAQVIKDSVKTDLPIDALQSLVAIRSKLKTDEMITVGFTPPHYTSGRNSLGYNILDLELVQGTVRQIIENPEQALATLGSDAELDTSNCWKIEP
jgi:LCP family protein required for cell wall assembly